MMVSIGESRDLRQKKKDSPGGCEKEFVGLMVIRRKKKKKNI